MKKISIIVLFVLSCNQTIWAQSKIDSIESIIETTASDSSRARAYIDLGYEFMLGKLDGFDKTFEAANNALVLAEKNKEYKIIISALNLKARAYYNIGDLKNAEAMHRKNIAISQKAKFNNSEFYSKDNLAYVLAEVGKKDEALKLKLECLEYFTAQKDSNAISISLSGIGWVYMTFEDWAASIPYYQRAIPIAKSTKNPGIIELYGNLGIVYEKLNQLDSSLFYINLADSLGQAYPGFILNNKLELAEVYKKMNKQDEALKTLLECHTLFKKDSKDKEYQITKLYLAKYFLDNHNLSEAQKYLETINAHMMQEDLSQKKEYGELGMNYYERIKDYKKALEFSKMYKIANDSLIDLRRDSSFKTIESKYNVAKKQETINAQKLKIRNYTIGLLVLLALACIAGLLFYHYRKQNILKEKIATQKAKEIKTERDNLKKENKIISMQSMLEGQEDERRRIAQDLHDNIGTLMTSIKMKFISIQKEVEAIQEMNIAQELDGMTNNASQEVRRISHRMTPRVLELTGLYGSTLELNKQLTAKGIGLKSNLEAFKEITDKKISINVYRILQELYTNIIKHSQASKVSILTNIENNILIIRLRDNGIGMNEDNWNNKNTIGLNGIQDRLEYLNGELKQIEDSGTHIKLSVPLT